MTMVSRSCHAFAWLTWMLAGAVGLAGCQGRAEEDYVPSTADAREALKRALDAWQHGERPGRIEGQPAIQIGDTHRRPGQKLTHYEIAGELPSGEGRLFAVRATFDSPAAEEKINYLVVGMDPLWVIRQEDYHTMTRWEHNMPAAEDSTRSEAPNPKQLPSAKAE